MRGFEQRLCAAVLLLITFGMVWSLAARDWQYFERSGSLIILVGIHMTWRDFVQLLGRVEVFYHRQVEQLSVSRTPTQPSGLLFAEMVDPNQKGMEALSSEVREVFANMKRRLRTIEAFVLGLGTFVWGYGSPIGNLFWSFQ